MGLFYELVQVALGQKDKLSRLPSDKDWANLFLLFQKQAVIGITFKALEKLNQQGQRPPLSLLYEWIGQVEQIKLRNLLINKRFGEITKFFLMQVIEVAY